MKRVYARPAKPADEEKFVKWTAETPNNLADPSVVLEFTACAFNEDGQILFAPVQRPLFMEALAINPAAKETEVAAGLNAAMQLIVSQCHIRGIGEVYFLCADESTKKFAEHHGFEKVPFDLYRLKIGDLEKS